MPQLVYRFRKYHSWFKYLIAIVAISIVTPLTFADRERSNSKVVPANAKYRGLSYSQWTARHNQWSLSLPIDEHPLFETAGAGTGQVGKVWFLGGTFSAIEIEPQVVLGLADRTICIPEGTALFFPLINVEGSTIEGNGETEAELRDFVNFITDFIDPSSLFLTIDGRPYEGASGLRFESPLHTIGPLPDNNVIQFFGFDAPAGTTSPSVVDGYYALLKPLSEGVHTLHFGGRVDLTPIGGPTFIQDIRYTIHVGCDEDDD